MCDDTPWNPQTIFVLLTCMVALGIIICAVCVFLGRVNRDNTAFYQSVGCLPKDLRIPALHKHAQACEHLQVQGYHTIDCVQLPQAHLCATRRERPTQAGHPIPLPRSCK
jgi:hypothetical protein